MNKLIQYQVKNRSKRRKIDYYNINIKIYTKNLNIYKKFKKINISGIEKLLI